MNTEKLFEYSASPATETMRQAPRFGHSSDFSALFRSTAEMEDYLRGLIFAGAFILATGIAWAIVLLILKCLGKNRVGFLSGAPFTTDSPRPFYVRIAFINAAILFIVFTVLSVTNGITNLYSAVDTVGDSNTQVQSILSDARGIAISLKSIGQSSAEVRQELSSNLGNFCPAEPNVEAVTGIDFDSLATEAISLLNQLGDFIENDVDNFTSQLRTVQATSTLVGDTVDTIQANDWQSLVILVPYLTLAVCMLIGVGLAWCHKGGMVVDCMLSWFVLPLFIICTLAAFFISAFVCFTAVANADACSGGAAKTPDGTVYSILESQNIDRTTLYYKSIRYYLEQCTVAEDPFQFIRDYQEEIESARTIVSNLSESLQAVSVERLNLICGKDFGPFEGLLNTMTSNLQILSDNARDALGLLSCERIVPLYVNSVYGATCTYSINGVTWTWAAFFVVAFMGMIMITFRSSYLPNDIKYVNDDISSMQSIEEEVRKSYMPQKTTEMTDPPSGDTSPRAEDDDDNDDDEHSMSDLSSVYIYGTDYQVSFDENSQFGR